MSNLKTRFSSEELSDLLKAWIALSLAFSIARAGFKFLNPQIILPSALIVGIAFIVHELGHKFVAQRYGLWAEFRADEMMLIMATLLAFTGIVFAAPGAVIILGASDLDTYGKTALAGPITNIIAAIVFFILLQTPFAITSPLIILIPIFYLGFNINAWLAFFNLIPFGPLDGAKVIRWSKPIWAVMFIFSAILSFVV